MTKIEWCQRPGTKGEVWNPVTGCTKVSAGCKHCYAERVAERFWPTQYAHTVERGFIATKDYHAEQLDGRLRQFTDIVCHEDRLDIPLRWTKPRTVFVNSMSDLYHETVPDAFIDRVFAVMALCPQHTFIVLTKRPERMQKYLGDGSGPNVLRWAGPPLTYDRIKAASAGFHTKGDRRVTWPLPNVWLGVSVEDQETANQRIPLLWRTPSAVRLVSAEPLLGPIDMRTGIYAGLQGGEGGTTLDGIDWLIVGGESGHGARPCDVAWVRFLKDQAKAAGVACFVKQLGADARGICDWPYHGEFPPQMLDQDGCNEQVGRPPFSLCHSDGDYTWPCRLKTKNRKGGDPSEWPEDLRVREWPARAVKG